MTQNTSRNSEIDKCIGQRVHMRRLAMGMTQRDLGTQVDLTFQQIQKYESGAARISCSRLLQIAIALDVSPGVFFPTNTGAPLTNVNGVVDVDELSNLVDRPDTISLLRAFKQIPTVRDRALLIGLVESYAERNHRYKQTEHDA